jgi:hypothetical protein
MRDDHVRAGTAPWIRRDAIGGVWGWAMGGALAAMLAVWAGQAPAQSGTVKMEWLSWSIFRFTSPTGKVIPTNPDQPVRREPR